MPLGKLNILLVVNIPKAIAAIAANMKAIHYIPTNSFYKNTIQHKNITQISEMATLKEILNYK